MTLNLTRPFFCPHIACTLICKLKLFPKMHVTHKERQPIHIYRRRQNIKFMKALSFIYIHYSGGFWQHNTFFPLKTFSKYNRLQCHSPTTASERIGSMGNFGKWLIFVYEGGTCWCQLILPKTIFLACDYSVVCQLWPMPPRTLSTTCSYAK